MNITEALTQALKETEGNPPTPAMVEWFTDILYELGFYVGQITKDDPGPKNNPGWNCNCGGKLRKELGRKCDRCEI